MLQNSRVTAFTVSELLSQNQDEGTKFTVMGQFGINFAWRCWNSLNPTNAN